MVLGIDMFKGMGEEGRGKVGILWKRGYEG